uniref:Uncharacterized protein n=1 Tax=Lotharella globosa TaxID=91324 RepID=A0A7S4DT29_9EUKA
MASMPFTLYATPPDEKRKHPFIYRSRPVAPSVLHPGVHCSFSRDVEDTLAALFDELQAEAREFTKADEEDVEEEEQEEEEEGRIDLRFEFECNKSGCSGLPYYKQGDSTADTPRTFEIRQGLLEHKTVVRTLQLFWETFAKNPLGEVPFDEYVQVHMRMAKALREGFGDEEYDHETLLSNAKDDWHHDIRKQLSERDIAKLESDPQTTAAHSMNKETLFASLFEIADIWTEGIGPKKYSGFLLRLFHRITNKKSPPTGEQEEDEDEDEDEDEEVADEDDIVIEEEKEESEEEDKKEEDKKEEKKEKKPSPKVAEKKDYTWKDLNDVKPIEKNSPKKNIIIPRKRRHSRPITSVCVKRPPTPAAFKLSETGVQEKVIAFLKKTIGKERNISYMNAVSVKSYASPLAKTERRLVRSSPGQQNKQRWKSMSPSSGFARAVMDAMRQKRADAAETNDPKTVPKDFSFWAGNEQSRQKFHSSIRGHRPASLSPPHGRCRSRSGTRQSRKHSPTKKKLDLQRILLRSRGSSRNSSRPSSSGQVRSRSATRSATASRPATALQPQPVDGKMGEGDKNEELNTIVDAGSNTAEEKTTDSKSIAANTVDPDIQTRQATSQSRPEASQSRLETSSSIKSLRHLRVEVPSRPESRSIIPVSVDSPTSTEGAGRTGGDKRGLEYALEPAQLDSPSSPDPKEKSNDVARKNSRCAKEPVTETLTATTEESGSTTREYTTVPTTAGEETVHTASEGKKRSEEAIGKKLQNKDKDTKSNLTLRTTAESRAVSRRVEKGFPGRVNKDVESKFPTSEMKSPSKPKIETRRSRTTTKMDKETAKRDSLPLKVGNGISPSLEEATTSQRSMLVTIPSVPNTNSAATKNASAPVAIAAEPLRWSISSKQSKRKRPISKQDRTSALHLGQPDPLRYFKHPNHPIDFEKMAEQEDESLAPDSSMTIDDGLPVTATKAPAGFVRFPGLLKQKEVVESIVSVARQVVQETRDDLLAKKPTERVEAVPRIQEKVDKPSNSDAMQRLHGRRQATVAKSKPKLPPTIFAKAIVMKTGIIANDESPLHSRRLIGRQPSEAQISLKTEPQLKLKHHLPRPRRRNTEKRRPPRSVSYKAATKCFVQERRSMSASFSGFNTSDRDSTKAGVQGAFSSASSSLHGGVTSDDFSMVSFPSVKHTQLRRPQEQDSLQQNQSTAPPSMSDAARLKKQINSSSVDHHKNYGIQINGREHPHRHRGSLDNNSVDEPAEVIALPELKAKPRDLRPHTIPKQKLGQGGRSLEAKAGAGRASSTKPLILDTTSADRILFPMSPKFRVLKQKGRSGEQANRLPFAKSDDIEKRRRKKHSSTSRFTALEQYFQAEPVTMSPHPKRTPAYLPSLDLSPPTRKVKTKPKLQKVSSVTSEIGLPDTNRSTSALFSMHLISLDAIHGGSEDWNEKDHPRWSTSPPRLGSPSAQNEEEKNSVLPKLKMNVRTTGNGVRNKLNKNQRLTHKKIEQKQPRNKSAERDVNKRLLGKGGSLLTDRKSIEAKRALRYHRRRAFVRKGIEPLVVSQGAALSSSEFAKKHQVESWSRYAIKVFKSSPKAR